MVYYTKIGEIDCTFKFLQFEGVELRTKRSLCSIMKALDCNYFEDIVLSKLSGYTYVDLYRMIENYLDPIACSKK